MLGETIGPLLWCLHRPLLQQKLKQQDEDRNKNQSKILKEMSSGTKGLHSPKARNGGSLLNSKNRRL